MNPDLDVDAAALRDAATSIEATASRVREAVAAAPSPVPGPSWATTGAAGSAADTAERRLRELGTDLSETAQQIKNTITAYGDADARAATRLGATR
ncbi:type VII secretion target [Actinoplanes regularis]|uniref:Excreted virulence factor EspC, type VII ESX diderm n=1 Tax=Actinoplanes regularis TaxID=52697 RepID=A0A238XBR1_9ACTN|nr:type VII secretion target [Actinoplanes regularis]GIE86652.1 hypothetical protein Are01nite_31320 [Actinoplanes regularis]GLW31323.1 hypothetical protein Areg01_42630 [Actinoplanes regularis]SNR56407.1 Excreted virulence factor EspC, type VII ESX diderm [Actinoplanes regularis]